MPTFQTFTPTRAEWQKLRDKHKVPQGAVPKISIGADLELVTKTAAIGTIAKHEAATVALMKDVDLYVKALKGGKHAAFATVVTDKVKGPATNQLKLLQERKAAVGQYPAAWNSAQKLLKASADRKALLAAFEKLAGIIKVQMLFDPSWKKQASANRLVLATLESGAELNADGYMELNRALAAMKP